MGRKKKSELESGIEKIVRKEIEEMSGESDPDIPPEAFDDSMVISPQEDPKLNRILSSFPSTEGYYGKLYRKNHSGKLEFKYFIDHLEEIDDPELEIANLIQERGWKGGEYILRVMKRNESGAVKVISWNMSTDETQSATLAPESNPQLSPIENLQSVKELITTVKDITGTDSKDAHKVIAETFKSGVDAMKDMIPKASGNGNVQVDSANIMNSVVNLMEKMGAFKQKEEPKQDPLELLIRLKTAGLIQMPGEKDDNTLDSVAKIGQLIEVLAPYTKGGMAEAPSIWVKIIEILGPQVPKIVENITSTINNVAEVTKIKLSARMNAPILTPTPEIAPIPPAQVEQSEMPEVKKEADTMNPLVRSIYDAVKNNDTNFYPQLKNTITVYIGQHAINALISGTITAESFLQQISPMIPFAYEPDTIKYFNEFVAWMVEQNPKPFIVKCDKCYTEFEYHNEDEFKKDSNICECGGKLEPMQKEVLGNA